MIGLIIKLCATFVALVLGALVILNFVGVIKPGTIALRTPDVAPCQRVVASMPVEYVHVRWVWHAKAYGWGCFYELGDGTTGTIAPMPR